VKLPPEIEQLPDVVRAYIRARDEQVAQLEVKVEHVMRANRSYSAGFAIRHREADEQRNQLELAMFWGREMSYAARNVDGLVESRERLLARVAELESDTAITNRQDDAQVRHLLDAYTEGQERLAAVRKEADRMRDWLLAARKVASDRGAKPESIAELDIMLADYDLAVAGFG
jgi:hypothetical protein